MCSELRSPGPGGLGVQRPPPVPVGTERETHGGRGGAESPWIILLAYILLSCAFELRNFTPLGISDEASKALLPRLLKQPPPSQEILKIIISKPPSPARPRPSGCCNLGLSPNGGCPAFPKDASGGTEAPVPPRGLRLPPGGAAARAEEGAAEGTPGTVDALAAPRPAAALGAHTPCAREREALREREPWARGRGGAGHTGPAPRRLLSPHFKAFACFFFAQKLRSGCPRARSRNQAPGAGAGAAGGGEFAPCGGRGPGAPASSAPESGGGGGGGLPDAVGSAGHGHRAGGGPGADRGTRGSSGGRGAGRWGPGG